MSLSSIQTKIIQKLKFSFCKQVNCQYPMQSTNDLIVIAPNIQQKIFKLMNSGFMCAQCIIDNKELRKHVQPLEKNTLSIRNLVKIFTVRYQEYLQKKNSLNWQPELLFERKQLVKQILSIHEEKIFTSLKQILTFISQLQKKTLEQIKDLHRNESFEKIIQLLNEQDIDQILKKNVQKELSDIASNIMKTQTKYKMANLSQKQERHKIILIKYKKAVNLAKNTIEQLIKQQIQILADIEKIIANNKK